MQGHVCATQLPGKLQIRVVEPLRLVWIAVEAHAELGCHASAPRPRVALLLASAFAVLSPGGAAPAASSTFIFQPLKLDRRAPRSLVVVARARAGATLVLRAAHRARACCHASGDAEEKHRNIDTQRAAWDNLKMTVRVLCRSTQRDQVVAVAQQRGEAAALRDVEWLIADNKEAELEHAPSADAIWTSRDTMVIDAAKKCRWVQVGSAGVDSVDMTQLNDRGIELTNAAVIYGPALADHNMALILAWSRQLPFLFKAQQQEKWESRRNFPGGELAKQTILVVGLGGAGTMTAARAKGFGMHVIGTRRRADEPLPPCVDEQVSDIVALGSCQERSMTTISFRFSSLLLLLHRLRCRSSSTA